MSQELAAMEKHEVLCQILGCFGGDPSAFSKAEEIFDKVIGIYLLISVYTICE